MLMKIVIQCLRILFVSVFLLSFFSCDFHLYDPDKPKPGYLDEMPEETSIGANTFGCYVNGELAATQGWYQEEGVELYDWSSSARYVNGFWEKYRNDTCMKLKIHTKGLLYHLRIVDTPFIGANNCYFL